MKLFKRKVRIYLDDTRKTPNGWIRAYNYDDAIALLTQYKGRVAAMSFDHDLGLDWELYDGQMPWDEFMSLSPTGYDVLCWIEKEVAQGNKKVCPDTMLIHSANPVGRKNMQLAIDSINRLRA